MRGRRGFTLVEMMFASTILTLVLGGVFSLFLGVQRLSRTAFAEAELAVRMRELREKLLFHAAPPHDGKVWSGILSGTASGNRAVVEGGVKVRMDTCWGLETASVKPVAQTVELVRRTDGDRSWFGNDGDRHDERWQVKWLCPGGYSNLPAEGFVDDEHLDAGVFFVALEMSANGVTRRERVTVPVFGALQPMGGRVFDD